MRSFLILMGLLASVLLIYILLPIVSLIIRLLDLDLIKSLTRPELLGSLQLSLFTATISTLICVITGIPLSYLMVRRRFRINELIRILVIIPLTLPPLIVGALLLTAYGVSSPIGNLAKVSGFSLTQSVYGIILAQIFVSSPFVILTANAAFERVNRYYEYTSRILGKGMMFTFFKITLPLASRGIAAGILLAWVRSIGEFGATVMMAYNPKTVSIQLWEDNAIGGLNLALPGVLLVIMITFLSLVFWTWISGWGKKGMTLGV